MTPSRPRRPHPCPHAACCSRLPFPFCPPLAAGAADPRGLEITFIDVEGGAARLIVTPAGESVLIDCGFPGARDAERIHQAAEAAGLKANDHLVVTHWHLDHYGAVERLSKLMPIRHFYDGSTVPGEDRPGKLLGTTPVQTSPA